MVNPLVTLDNAVSLKAHVCFLIVVVGWTIMVSSTIVLVVLLQISVVVSEFCVLEPLLTISQPLCVTQSCPQSSSSARRKRSARNNTGSALPLVTLGSASSGHFQSVKDDDDSLPYRKYSGANAIELECDEDYLYRSLDGTCNNLNHTEWGKSNSPYLRLLYPRYSNNSIDGIPLSVSGNQLPKTRVISTTLFPDKNRPILNFTLVVMQWGQLVAHDVTKSPSATYRDYNCCAAKTNIPVCYTIPIPKNDPFYSQFNVRCLNLIRTRSIEEVTYNCNKIPYQINAVSQNIDLSFVYGSSSETDSALREYQGGLLQVDLTANFREFPLLSPNPAADCNSQDPTITCFHSGDSRINQNTLLTCLQTVLLREHNRIANILANLNTNWTDETIFQEARNIAIGQFQHITYNEYLPVILGEKYMTEHDLQPLKEGYIVYRDDVHFGTINSFATAAFRVFHSQIQGQITMYNESKCPFKNLPINQGRCPFRQLNISDYMNRPGIILEDNNYDSLLLGLSVSPPQQNDRYFTTQMTEMMFHGDAPYGEDLESFDIQRGRDHGLPSYNQFRKLCNLSEAETFHDLKDEISLQNIELLQSVYEHVDDIDLFVGLAIETLVEDALVGPTALCIIGEQFTRKKFGDRFWYEVGDMNHSFNEEQLQEIRKSSLSRLLCDNSDNITTIQPNSFLSASLIGNEIQECDLLPSLNLTKWKIT